MLRVIVLLFSAALLSAQNYEFRDENPKLVLYQSARPFFAYNYGMVLAPGFPESMSRSTYLHPVWFPDGTVATDDFNKDHPHHRGISWMWPVVVVDGQTYDVWTVGGLKQRFLGWEAREARGSRARLAVRNGWFTGDRKVVDESAEILAGAGGSDTRTLDFTLTFEASEGPVEIAGTPDQNKGFGGFCFRLAPRDGGKDATVIRSETGVASQDGVMEKHRWAQVEGKFQGKLEAGRVYDDPRNPGYPNGWLMRHGFGFLNVSYPGLEHIRLVRGKPLVLRYKVSLYSGAAPAK